MSTATGGRVCLVPVLEEVGMMLMGSDAGNPLEGGIGKNGYNMFGFVII